MNDIVSTLKEIIFERMRRKLVITVENGVNSSIRVSPDSFGGPPQWSSRGRVLLGERLRIVTPRASEWLIFLFFFFKILFNFIYF